MIIKKALLVFLALAFAYSAPVAAVDSDDLPGDTIWYLHADLAGMRDSETGRDLYRWLDGEVFAEVNEETGIDISRELERVTAFSAEGPGVTVVLDGTLSQETKDKLMAIAALQGNFDPREHDGKAYFFAGENDNLADTDDPFGNLAEAAFVSFALPNKVLVSSSEGQMRELLQSGGKIVGSSSLKGALFVMTADKSFVQAGMRAEHFASDDDDNWNSNILRNTEQAALLVADRGGLLAVEAQLKSTDEMMARSISSVINGLIGLQAFNSEIDPQIRTMISNTKVNVADAVLSISTVIDPALLVQLLSD